MSELFSFLGSLFVGVEPVFSVSFLFSGFPMVEVETVLEPVVLEQEVELDLEVWVIAVRVEGVDRTC